MTLTISVGAVVIGRNEGQRLKACLESLKQELQHIIYVDSGSTDNSVEIAEQLNIQVVNLDLSTPFTAARARNVGFNTLTDTKPDLDYVHFIDGDCQIIPGWLDAALSFLATHPEYAVTCGRRRERFPEHSVYNRLCEIEWNTPVGDATACGGDALMRITALQQVGGYRDDLIAGEEPELCFRLRGEGWKIWRLDHDMTLHDAAMQHFGQWWQRSKRGGFAYAAGSALHGQSPEKYWVRETRSILFWGGLLPLLIALSALFIDPWFHCLWLIYLVQILKIGFRNPMDKNSWRTSLCYGYFVMLAKFPQFIGVFCCYFAKIFATKAKLIEYK